MTSGPAPSDGLSPPTYEEAVSCPVSFMPPSATAPPPLPVTSSLTIREPPPPYTVHDVAEPSSSRLQHLGLAQNPTNGQTGSAPAAISASIGCVCSLLDALGYIICQCPMHATDGQSDPLPLPADHNAPEACSTRGSKGPCDSQQSDIICYQRDKLMKTMGYVSSCDVNCRQTCNLSQHDSCLCEDASSSSSPSSSSSSFFSNRAIQVCRNLKRWLRS